MVVEAQVPYFRIGTKHLYFFFVLDPVGSISRNIFILIQFK